MRRLIISDKLYNYITEKLTEKYGQNVDPLITKRLEDEWDTICTKELESEYYNLAILISYIKEQGYSYMLPIGRTLMTYLMDTSSPNPLPPHKYCRECKKVFCCNDIIDKIDGFDTDVCVVVKPEVKSWIDSKGEKREVKAFDRFEAAENYEIELKAKEEKKRKKE